MVVTGQPFFTHVVTVRGVTPKIRATSALVRVRGGWGGSVLTSGTMHGRETGTEVEAGWMGGTSRDAGVEAPDFHAKSLALIALPAHGSAWKPERRKSAD